MIADEHLVAQRDTLMVMDHYNSWLLSSAQQRMLPQENKMGRLCFEVINITTKKLRLKSKGI